MSLVVAIIQARLNSTRLPKKMLIPVIDKKGSLELMLERVNRTSNLTKIVVSTTNSNADDGIVNLCKKLSYDFFRGSEEDVLDRMYQTALYYSASTIVRLTGDCPLYDHKLAEEIIDFYLKNDFDYVSNVIPPSYPDGLDIEVFSFSALQKTWQEAKSQGEREHVTYYIRIHPEIFKTKNIEHEEDLSHKGWSLDTKKDFEFIKEIYNNLYAKKKDFDRNDIFELLKNDPKIEALNSDEPRNAWLQKL